MLSHLRAAQGLTAPAIRGYREAPTQCRGTREPLLPAVREAILRRAKASQKDQRCRENQRWPSQAAVVRGIEPCLESLAGSPELVFLQRAGRRQPSRDRSSGLVLGTTVRHATAHQALCT